MEFNGIRVIQSLHATKRVQFRFPRSKSKRIRKKFQKNEKNFRTEPTAYFMQNRNSMVVHPTIYKTLTEIQEEKHGVQVRLFQQMQFR